jgi:hypothetical protein
VSSQNPFSLPTKEPSRTTSISIRLSEQERQAIDDLAERLDVSPSHMARHFLLQVVAFQSARTPDRVKREAPKPDTNNKTDRMTSAIHDDAHSITGE